MSIDIYGDLQPKPNPFIIPSIPLCKNPRVVFREYEPWKISWFSVNERKHKLNIHSYLKSRKNDLLKLLRKNNLINRRRLFKLKCL